MTDHAKAIRQAMKERKLSQQELAEMMGQKNHSYVGNLLTRDARISSINKAAAALGIKTSTLLRKGE